MKPRISVLTLGVNDLERAVAFYRDGLGLPTEGIVGREFDHGAVAFFDLQSHVKLAVWARDDVAHDTGLPKTAPSPTGFTIGHNVTRKDEVDQVMEQAHKAGAKILKPAQDTFWGGYAGYFQDPDGHVGSVALTPRGTIYSVSASLRVYYILWLDRLMQQSLAKRPRLSVRICGKSDAMSRLRTP